MRSLSFKFTKKKWFDNYEKSINFEEIDIPPEKRQKIWNELREVL